MVTNRYVFRGGIALLWIGLLLAYSQTLFYPPLNYDDHSYLNLHPLAQESLFSGSFWAQLFQGSTVNLWTPLTDLSHQLLFRLSSKPGIHHLGNVLLHGINATLWVYLLRFTTKNEKLSLAVGLLFAWNPLTVESVAWISGRKDLLSTFFITLALLSHVSWSSSKNKRFFFTTIIAFIAAICSKPIAFITPLLLLAFDFWPLQRSEKPLILLREKIPFFLLSLVSVVLTLQFQSEGGQSVADGRSFIERSAGSLWALQHSLRSLAWPLNLHLAYQDPTQLPLELLLVFSIVLLAVFLLVIRFQKQHPALLLGVFWYLLAIGPTLGLIRAGNHLAADRYSYLPLIGFLIASASLLKSHPKRLLWLTTWLAIPLLILSTFQVRTWHSTETLFTNTLKHQPQNSEAHAQLGRIALQRGNSEKALSHLKKALTLQPTHADANLNLGHIHFKKKSYAEAYQHFHIAAELRPREASLQERLAVSAYGMGKKPKAREHFAEAFQLEQPHDKNLKLLEKWERLFSGEPPPR